MSSPSLPLVLQWLEISIGVNQAFSNRAFELSEVTSPLSALPAQIIWPAHEKLSYDRASVFILERHHGLQTNEALHLLSLDVQRKTKVFFPLKT